MNKITSSLLFGVAIGLFIVTVLISQITDFDLFSPRGFIPQSLAGNWTSGLIALHNFADFLIWASFIVIPIILIKFANKRVNEIPFPHLFWFFSLFLLASGTTHLVNVILFYEPVYRLSGVMKLFTAITSVGTVFVLVKVFPSALRLKSPETMQTEINERKRVEEQLREREKQLSDAQKIARLGSWRWDIVNNTITWTDELYRIFGVKPNEAPLSFESYLQRVHPEDRDATKKIIERSLRIMKPFSFFEKIIRPDGEMRILHSQGEIIGDLKGQPAFMIGTCQDVTHAKEQEEELKRTRDKLEERVKERTDELMKINETLQNEIAERKKAIERTEAALREKEILLKEVHHRVKNNLQIISSLINLQSRQIEDRNTKSFFNQTKNRIGSIALVHEKLYKSPDISRINIEEYITELVQNIYDTFNTENSNISLKLNVEKTFLSIDTAISLALIVNEIASNSFKYAFPNNRKGEFCISLKKDESSRLILTLRDDGIGFEKNIDFNSTATLGLRLVKVLVEQIGGSIVTNNLRGIEYIITISNEEK